MSIKTKLLTHIDSLSPRLIELSHTIHAHPEVSNEEVFACNLLSTELLKHKFEVTQDIAGHTTGFIATKSSSKLGPTIGLLVEYDALPGLGHACGHNLIAATSLGAALALGCIIEEVGGAIKVFGTPAEEGGVNGSAKASFVKAGLFEGVDVALMTHPGSHNQPTPSSLAIAPMDFEFFGKPAHAASAPHEGINALDALLLFYNGINALRQQLTADIRIHGVILDGGTAPNIIPDYTRARFYLRAGTVESLNIVIEKVKHIADGSALMTGCTTKYTHIQHILDNLVPNAPLDSIFTSILH
ncbi:MAG: M20 family metallopeptidase, partial [Niameybacter sp.]